MADEGRVRLDRLRWAVGGLPPPGRLDFVVAVPVGSGMDDDPPPGVHFNADGRVAPVEFDGPAADPALLVAGCAAVVRQFLRTKAGIAKPTGALMKAVLVHSAQYRKNRFAHPKAAAPADNEQGWGRVDLRAALAPPAPVKVLFLEPVIDLS